jgi:sulfur-carrier protein
VRAEPAAVDAAAPILPADRVIAVRLLLFAVYREIAGTDECVLSLAEGSRVADVVAALRARGGRWAQLPAEPMAAVNRAYAPATAVLHDGDELALIPPVSGG